MPDFIVPEALTGGYPNPLPLAAPSLNWLQYFYKNREHLLLIPWNSQYQLTAQEKTVIAYSIQKFQLGESSEGAHLMKLARAYAEQVGDPHWVEVVKLFIGEEQRHAKDLARFMQQQQIPLTKHHWSDSLFRKLRRLANLKMALAILLTAEIIATVYYKALGNATESPVLQQLCSQILQDEVQHVRFQAETLGKIRHTYSGWQLALVDAFYYWFFRITTIAVWLDHYSVLHASGYTFREFYQAVCEAMQSAYQKMQA
jgi:hypothetical protein